MNGRERASEVRRLRAVPLQGRIVTLEPYGDLHHEAVIRLRNTARARHFLSQAMLLTPESQAVWYRGYLDRDNDLQWIIRDHKGRVAGATAIYDIDLSGGESAEKGRLVIDEVLSKEAPLVLEAELLLLSAAFRNLRLAGIYTRVRPDNPVMLSINERLGFRETGRSELRGAEMIVQTLEASAHRPEKLNRVIEHWSKRIERAAS